MAPEGLRPEVLHHAILHHVNELGTMEVWKTASRGARTVVLTCRLTVTVQILIETPIAALNRQV